MPKRLRRGLAQSAQGLLDWLHESLTDLVDRVPQDSQKVSCYFRPQLEAALHRVIIVRALMGVTQEETPQMTRAKEILGLPVDTSLERSQAHGGHPNPTRSNKRC